MEKNPSWLESIPESLKKPFRTMYDLIFSQDAKIKELEMNLAETVKKLEETEKKLAVSEENGVKTAEVAKNAVIRAEKAETRIEQLEHKSDIANKFI